MEVAYKKDIRHNYMVITEEELSREPYCIRMLEKQSLTGVLSLQQHFMDNKTLYYYDITGKQSMINLFARISLSFEQLRQLISSLLDMMELAYKHLLPEDDFILDPEYIYIDVSTYAPQVCFLSGYHQESRGQMSRLLEYLMNKVDYNDKEAVLLVYRLYAVSKEEGYTFSHMKEELDKRWKTQAHTNSITLEMGSHIPWEKDCEPEPGKATKPERYETYRNQEIEDIPVVMEKQEDEKEVLYYPSSTYIITGICGLGGILIPVLGFTSGILYNSYGEQIEYSRLIGLLLILLCVGGYLMRKLWSKENRLTRIETRSEYIDPRQEYEASAPDSQERAEGMGSKPKMDLTHLTKREYSLWKEHIEAPEKTSDYEEIKLQSRKEETVMPEDTNPTCLLNNRMEQQEMDTNKILLKSMDVEEYASVPIEEFPFFIGKLRKNVDFCLEKSVVSRYHAKLTREEDRYYITDLNSTNGTFVNESPLSSYEKKELMQGDRITLANLSFEFRLN